MRTPDIVALSGWKTGAMMASDAHGTYDRQAATLTLDAGAVHKLVSAVIVAGGWSEIDGSLVADNLIGADQTGHASHGVGLLPGYVETIKSGRLTPANRPRTLKDDGIFLVVDGGMSLGQVAACDLTRRGIEIARGHGVAVVNLVNSHHVGRIGHYGEMVAREGFVGLFWVNVHGRKPTVVPFGAREPRFSTNPHCVAIPRRGGEPFLLDFATAEIAVNKARVAWAQGKKVRAGVLVDPQGRPTDDPGVLFRQPRGSIATFGLHKGSGLALACEIMSSALSGGPLVADQEDRGAICNNMMAIVIDPARMATGEEDIAAATERLMVFVKSAAAAEGVDEVLVPGEPETATRRRLAGRIEIDPTTWGRIEDAARSIGVGAELVPKPIPA
jgi:uncharacterized oxidoreductase